MAAKPIINLTAIQLVYTESYSASLKPKHSR